MRDQSRIVTRERRPHSREGIGTQTGGMDRARVGRGIFPGVTSVSNSEKQFVDESQSTVKDFSLFAQEGTIGDSLKPEKEFVKSTFENGILINNNTVETPGNKSL